METKVLTAHLPLQLAYQVDQIAERLERSRGWIMKQALSNWVLEEEEKYQLTLQALQDVDQGHLVSQTEVENWLDRVNVAR